MLRERGDIGTLDQGLRFQLVSTPDDPGDVVIDVWPRFGHEWRQIDPPCMVGQAFGMNWRDKMFPLRVVNAQLTHDGMMRLTCR